MSAETLRAAVDAAVREERRAALRGLLQRPLLLARRDRDLLLLVRRHAVWLQAWLTTHPGWSLHLDAELARLVKTPSALLPPPTSHPACDPQHGLPFGRKRYVGFCLALAACERAGRQITLQRLAEDLQGQAAGDPVLVAAGLTWPLESRADRGDMVAVGRLLLDLGVLERIHGDEEGYLAGSGDCLYTIRRSVLARLLAVRAGPSLIEAAELDIPRFGEEGQPHLEYLATFYRDFYTQVRDAFLQRFSGDISQLEETINHGMQWGVLPVRADRRRRPAQGHTDRREDV